MPLPACAADTRTRPVASLHDTGEVECVVDSVRLELFIASMLLVEPALFIKQHRQGVMDPSQPIERGRDFEDKLEMVRGRFHLPLGIIYLAGDVVVGASLGALLLLIVPAVGASHPELTISTQQDQLPGHHARVTLSTSQGGGGGAM